MRKSRLIVNSLLLALLICLTSFNFTLLLYAGPVQCEEEGARECEMETLDYCSDVCADPPYGNPGNCYYVWFDWGECGCSGTCYQWWSFECEGGYIGEYECVTYGHGCPLK